MNCFDTLLIKAKCKKMQATQSFHDFMEEESGISSVVATVLLILMAVLLAGAVYGFMSGWFEAKLDIINGQSDYEAPNVEYTGP